MTQRDVSPIASAPGRRDTTSDRTATRGDVPGSRLLPTDRARNIQSGSPPRPSACDVTVLNRTLARCSEGIDELLSGRASGLTEEVEPS
jgi:hypothetical protein